MKILSIDTASNICGVSILEDTKPLCTLDSDTGRTHSENLMPMIEKAFKQTNLTLNDINLIICDKGPGSFTGIRIGIATAKAFHDSKSINYIGIDSLQSLAYNVKQEYGSNFSGIVCSIIDCKNQNCYFALYQFTNAICTTLISPSADTVEHSLELLKDYSNILFIGDSATMYSDIIKNKLSDYKFINNSSLNNLNSISLALAGYDFFINNGTEKDLLTLYLRKPQAQRQLEEKTLLNNINKKEN